jgi:hypothetical protein
MKRAFAYLFPFESPAWNSSRFLERELLRELLKLMISPRYILHFLVGPASILGLVVTSI